MSRSQPSTPKFVITAGIIIVMAGGLAALAIPATASWRHHQTQILVSQASRETGRTAESDLKLARLLSPHDDTLLVKLAQAQITDGHLDTAIKTLGPDRSEAGELLLAQTQMSLQRYADAITSYQRLVRDHPSTQAETGLAEAQMEQGSYANAETTLSAVDPGSSLAYQLWNYVFDLQGKTVANCSCTGSVTSPQALQAVLRARSSKLALAQELYALGLPDSSQRVLVKLGGQSSLEWMLRAKIALGRPTPDLSTAASALRRGLIIDPSNTEMRQLLLKILEQQGDLDGAKIQRSLLQQLSS